MFICMLGGARSVYRAGLDAVWDPIMGGAYYMFIMYGMWYFGELTKLCTYGFQFMFRVLPVPQGRARDDCRAHTTLFRIFLILM